MAIKRFYYPQRMNGAYFLVDDNANKWGDKVAILYRDQTITYEELQQMINRLGNGLKSLGLSKGDRFICRFPNIPEAAVIFLAGVKMGAVPVPCFPFLREEELEYMINNSDSVAVFTTFEASPPVMKVKDRCKGLKHVVTVGGCGEDQIAYEDLMKDSSPFLQAEDTSKDDLAFLCYSSGTTGIPKGLPHRHELLLCCVDTSREPLPIETGDVIYCPAPFAFAFGLAMLTLYPFRFGAAAVYEPSRLGPEEVFRLIEKYRVSYIVSAAPFIRTMLGVKDAEKRYNLRSLKAVGVGAGPAPKDLCEEWERRFGTELRPCYGSQEIVGTCISNAAGKVRPGTMGQVNAGWEVKVLDEEGDEVSEEKPGIMWIKGQCVIPYYWKDEEKTKELIKDGWLNTGDIVYKDKDGYYWFVGRQDEVIKSSGWSISPLEVEDVLLRHQAVMEVAVVGIPDPVKGQIPVAAVVLKEGYTPSQELEEELKAFVKERLAPFKCPQIISFLKELPKTSTGKVIRRKVREGWISF